MPALDVFNDDAFNMVSLTTAIDKLPYKPARLSGLFREQGVPTTTVVVEERDGKISLLQTAARGTMPNVLSPRGRTVRSFIVPHIPHNASIMADDVQGLRAFGSETQLQSVAKLTNDKMANMKQDHETTWEFHRLGAVKGTILDADGTSTIYNLFTEFGISQTTVNINFSTQTNLRGWAFTNIKRNVEAALGAAPYSSIRVLCGSTFFDRLIAHSDVKDAYERWQNGQFLRDDPRFTGFEYPKGVFWEEYRGSVGSVQFVAATKAHVYPEGVPGLFQRYNAPAPFMETVNTLGRAIYAKQERMKWDLGVELHSNSNPLHLCTRPKTLIELTTTG